MLHNYSTEAYTIFKVKISFEIDILLKMSTQKRKRTDLNQARKRLLLSFHNASDEQVNKFLHTCVADKKEKIFFCRLFDIFSLLPGMTLTSRENWYLVIIIGFGSNESYNNYYISTRYFLSASECHTRQKRKNTRHRMVFNCFDSAALFRFE